MKELESKIPKRRIFEIEPQLPSDIEVISKNPVMVTLDDGENAFIRVKVDCEYTYKHKTEKVVNFIEKEVDEIVTVLIQEDWVASKANITNICSTTELSIDEEDITQKRYVIEVCSADSTMKIITTKKYRDEFFKVLLSWKYNIN